tara:strand:+ start:5265 stop:8150 length:2886 start_codon:yes stop_codon:yes gene_type:complete
MIRNKLIIFFLILISNSVGSQDTFTSVRSGDWDDPTSAVPSGTTPWSYTGLDADGIPDEDDIVVVNVGHTIDLPSGNTRIKDLTCNGTVNLPSGTKLYLWSDAGASNLALNGNLSGSGEVVVVSYNSVISGTGSVESSVNLWVANLCAIDGMNIEFASQVKLQGIRLNIINNSNVTFSGTVFTTSNLCQLYNQATITVSTNNFFATGPSSDQILSNNFSNSTFIFNANGSLPLPKDNFINLTIGGNATSANNFSIKGNFVNNGTFESTTNDNTITFDGTSAQEISGSGTTTFKKIILDNSNGLTFSSTNINVNQLIESTTGSFTNNSSNVVLKSDANDAAGMLKVSNSSDYNGDITVERFFNSTSNDFRMVGSPIEDTRLSDWQHPTLSNGFLYCGFGGSNYTWTGCGNFCSVYFYNESQASDDDPTLGYDSATNITNFVTPAKGTIIYSSSGSKKLSVTGSPELDDFNVQISKGSNDSDRGWNLVSNPYPCTIDWSLFRTSNTGIDNANWIYSGDAGNFIQSTNNIPHSQGFWVKKTSSGTSNLSFELNHTVSTETNFTRSTNGINIPLKLELSSDVNSYIDYASVLASPNFTNNYDPGEDLFKFMSPIPDFAPNIYFYDNQGNKLDKTCINNNLSQDLFFDTRISEYAQGNYKIEFHDLSTFMIGSCILVEDLHTGIFTDLRQDSVINFISDTLAPNPRFKLQINSEYDINVTNLSCYNDNSGKISISGNGISGFSFSIICGIDTVSTILANSDSLIFENLSSGLYYINTNHVSNCAIENQNIILIEPDQILSDFIIITDSVFEDTLCQFQNLSTGGSYYNWDFGDGSNSNEINPTHSFSNPGLYLTSLKASNDSSQTCSSESLSLVEVNGLTSSKSMKQTANFSLTQSNGYIFVSSLNYNFIKDIQIFDSKGTLVFAKDNIMSNNSKINKVNFKPGIYIIILDSKGKNYSNKIVINNK